MTCGVVATFDDHRGYGTVVTTGGRELFFHCTAVTDGSRTIEVGTEVAFDEAPGHGGRWQATRLIPIPSPSGSEREADGDEIATGREGGPAPR